MQAALKELMVEQPGEKPLYLFKVSTLAGPAIQSRARACDQSQQVIRVY